MEPNLALGFCLLVAYQAKHYVADFPLQREYMLQKVLPSWDFFVPLFIHCCVHGALSLIIILMVNPSLWWLAIFDFWSHFLMDRIKSGPKYLGRFNNKEKPSFWNSFGLDQMVHHFTHYFIIWKLVTSLPVGGM